MEWIKFGHLESEEGTTVIYKSADCDLTIQSRKRHIPHANRPGTWDHTSYWLMRGQEEIKEFQRLSEAKEFAERMVAK